MKVTKESTNPNDSRFAIRDSPLEALDFRIFKLSTGRRLARLAPLALPYLGYLLFHVILSPVHTIRGALRARRRAYKAVMWSRFFGGPVMRRGRTLVMLAGGLGELRIANEFAHEIRELHQDQVALLVQTEVSPPAKLEGKLGGAPFNNPFSVALFLLKSRPRAIFAPEFCDNIHLKFAARILGIPMVIYNVNTTEREVQRTKRFSTWRWMLAGVYVTQNDAQRERLLQIGVGADQAFTLGSIGVFLEPPTNMAEIRGQWDSHLGLPPDHGPVVLCGSTHNEDEGIVFDAWDRFVNQNPKATMILAPRNRLRFDEVESTLHGRGITVVRRSSGNPAVVGGIFMLDTYGELANAYSVSDVAFIGGTYDNWRGGHTPSEALIWGVPLTLGPTYQQHTNVCDALIARGIAVVARDAAELAAAWEGFATNKELRQTVSQKTDDLSQWGRELGRELFKAVPLG